MPRTVYIETTIVSYLTAWPSRDLIRAAHQQITREWWEQRRPEYDLYISQSVVEEASSGDPIAATERLEVLSGIPLLAVNQEVIQFARRLASNVSLPARAAVDSLHIACAAVHGMEYLLTWNCRHIANATLRTPIEHVCRESGYGAPIICTPE